SQSPLIANPFENLGCLHVIFNTCRVFIEAVMNDTEIRKEPGTALLILVFSEPLLGNAGHTERFLEPSDMCESRHISDPASRRLPVLSHLFELLDRTFVIWNGFFVLLVCRKAVCQHSPRLKHPAIAAGICG